MKEILKGNTAYGKGIIKGKVKVIKNPSQNIIKDEIMVTEITTPLYFKQIVNSKAIITDFGGLLCHTAIMAREFNKPCIVGTEEATKILKDGQEIEIDCDKGVING